jgi:hypothetical protein
MPSIEFHCGEHEREKCKVCNAPSVCKFYVNDGYIELCTEHIIKAINMNIEAMAALKRYKSQEATCLRCAAEKLREELEKQQ